jgi:general stress protein 26
MSEHETREAKIEKVRELIGDIDFAMLTTVRPDGSLHSRPMAAQGGEFDGVLWFFTSASSHKVDDVERNHRVNVAFASPDEQKYISLSGEAQLVRDRARIEELWNPFYTAWFPEGVDDPDVALLRVEVDSAEYWEGRSSTVAHIFGLAKAALTGEPANVGENEAVKLK